MRRMFSVWAVEGPGYGGRGVPGVRSQADRTRSRWAMKGMVCTAAEAMLADVGGGEQVWAGTTSGMVAGPDQARFATRHRG